MVCSKFRISWAIGRLGSTDLAIVLLFRLTLCTPDLQEIGKQEDFCVAVIACRHPHLHSLIGKYGEKYRFGSQPASISQHQNRTGTDPSRVSSA